MMKANKIFVKIMVLMFCFTMQIYTSIQIQTNYSNEFRGKIEDFVVIDKSRLFIIEQFYTDKKDLKSRILKSNDGGKNWKVNLSVDNESFHKIYFVNNQLGFVGAYVKNTFQLYKTEDGGKKWDKINKNLSGFVEDFHFFDEQVGYILCDDNSFYRTWDGGKTWEKISLEITEVKSFEFKDKLNGWLINWDGEIYRTWDGGKSWSSNTESFLKKLEKWKPEKIEFINMKFINENEGFLGVRFKTTENIENYELNLTENNIVTDGGIIFTTKDGGKSWDLNLVTEELGISSFFVNKHSKIWVIPGYIWTKPGYFVSSINKIKWQNEKFIGNEGDPSDFYFLNNNIGWMITSGGDFDYLYRTLDGGKTWQ